ncbi:MAG: DUF6273 domain-containing protein, partial [Raoultibacter sp.]
IKAYGLPASQQALTLEVGQSANLFEPGTLQAPDPAKTVYAYEATCLSVSQEGTITAKAPGTTTITTTIELEETPLTHTTRTISVEAPSTPITPEQPEPPTPTPPIVQPITPRYPPNLATPVQASAPLYARGGTRPNVPVPSVGVTVPTAAPFSIDAAGTVTSKADVPLTITSTDTSTIAEPIRVTEITFDHGEDSQRLLPNPKDRENTTVSVAENPAKPEDPKVSKKLPLIPKPPAPPNPPTSWEPDPKSAPFRVETSTPLSITFGFKLPENAALSYVSDSDPKPVSLAKVEFTYGLLAPIATSLTLTSDKAIATPKVGDTLTAAPPSGEAASILNPTYTWYEVANTTDEIPTKAKVLQNTSSNTYKLLEGQNTKFICCALSDGPIDKPKDTNWTSRPVYSDLTAQVAPADPPPLPDHATLEAYSWAELDQVAKYLSDHRNDANNTVYNALYTKFNNFMRQGIGNTPTAGAKKSLGIDVVVDKQTVPLKVRIIGINHDNKADGGKAGLTFMTDGVVPGTYFMNSTNTNKDGWEASYMRNTTMAENSTVWNILKNAKSPVTADSPTPYIKAVLKDNKNCPNPTTTDKLFLLSNQEIIGSGWISGEGTQYPFFAGASLKNENTPNINPILRFGSNWWERSSYPNHSGSVVSCNTNGYSSYYNSASYQCGVAPGFSL